MYNQQTIFNAANFLRHCLNFAIDSLSPAINSGNVDIARLYAYDIKNNLRLGDAGPDIGAIEWIPDQ
jgi:hypothetical protein